MSFIEDVNIKWQDTGNIDAFGRARVSEVTTLLDIKQLHDNQPLLVDEVLNGGATSTHSTATASTEMQTAGSGDYAIRQTFQRTNYQSGKSHFILMTFAGMTNQTDVVKRIGYFTSSTTAPYTANLDGIFLESDGTSLYLKVYREGTEIHSIAQSDWDDPMDGSGKSRVNLNFTNMQIFAFDFQWLGAGRIRFYFEIAGQLVQCHQILNANVNASIYMSSPNQPLRWEIRQNGATTGRVTQICSSVNSEGATNLIGKVLSANASNNDLQLSTVGSKYAAIGIRLKTTHLDAIVDILEFDYLAETNDRALWELILNPTVGAGTFNYSDVTNSAVQISVGNQTAGTPPTVSNGTVLASGYVQGEDSVRLTIDSSIKIGSAIDGTRDEIILCITPIQAGLDAFVSYTWRELV